MSQSKFDVLKTEMPRPNIDILGTNELKWNGMGHFMLDNINSVTDKKIIEEIK